MKRPIAVILTLVMLLALTACSNVPREPEEEVTIVPVGDLDETPIIVTPPPAAETPEPPQEVTPEVTPEPTEEPTDEVTPEPTQEPSEDPAATEYNPDTDYHVYEQWPDDIRILAITIYREVGGDAACDLCRYRVGDIVINRVEDPRFPNTMYEVLTQAGQFANAPGTPIVWPERAEHPGEARAVERAYRIAVDIIVNGNHSDLYRQGYIYCNEDPIGRDQLYCDETYFGR